MRRRRFCLAALPFVGVANSLQVLADTGGQMKADKLVLPPMRREFRSPSGAFMLAVFSDDRWKTRLASAELTAAGGAGQLPLWRQTLPHEEGPRRAIVTDTGSVVLIDEWINIPSRHALMLIGKDGKKLAHHSIDEIIAILGVPRKAISTNAKLGIWLSSEPIVAADGSTMAFRVGGRGLVLKLSNGQLTAVD